MRFPRIITLLPLILLALAPAALAQELIGEAGKWQAYSYVEDGKKVCYMSAAPDKSEGNYKVRGEVYAQVTHWPAFDRRDEVRFVAGYALKPEQDVVVTVDRKQKFTLFPDRESAWARDAQTDRSLVQAMVKGGSMVVEGVSSRGTKTRDIYSLSGFGKMYQAISQACGLSG